jgi:serine/threonine protein kinase
MSVGGSVPLLLPSLSVPYSITQADLNPLLLLSGLFENTSSNSADGSRTPTRRTYIQTTDHPSAAHLQQPHPPHHHQPTTPETEPESEAQLFSIFVSLASGLALEGPQDATTNRFLGQLRYRDLGVLNKHQTTLGYGSSFSVTRCISGADDDIPGVGNLVFKRTIPTSTEQSAHQIQKRLQSLMLELRVLAHHPIRQHENIVKFLGIAWETDPLDLARRWPVIIMEHATYGTLSDFLNPTDSVTIPFKQKVSLALDVVLGLKALHACGILHGDVKADNVLIFRNREPDASNQRPIHAKVADFGGVLFDMQATLAVPSGTRPWNAPEWRERLSPVSLLKTDIYSLGFLIFRIMADGRHPFRDFGFADDPGWSKVEMLKKDQDKMLEYMLNKPHFHLNRHPQSASSCPPPPPKL